MSAKREALASQMPSSMNTMPSTQLPGREASPPFDQNKLQLFMDDHKQVTGFGWMNDNQFYWGQYNLDEVNKLDPNGF